LHLHGELLRRLDDALLLTTVDDHSSARFGQPLRYGVADARRRTADHRLLAGQIDAHVLSSCFASKSLLLVMPSSERTMCSAARST
jgi:hypothetical protein